MIRTEKLSFTNIVVVDIDGVLSNHGHRLHYLDQKPKNWGAFFEEVGEDPVNPSVKNLLAALGEEMGVVLLTGRPLDLRATTQSWLLHNDIRWDILIMRNPGSHLGVSTFKLKEITRLKQLGYSINFILDDSPENVQAFNEDNLPAILVASNYDPPKNSVHL